MKYSIPILLIFVCLSCQTNALEEEQGLFKLQNAPQKWELISITSSWTNETTTVDDLDWNEFYILRPDSTFLKSRETDGNTIEATGTFTNVDSSDRPYLELLFETGGELRASCSQGKELLSYKRNTLINGSWVACDGPRMVYRLAKD